MKKPLTILGILALLSCKSEIRTEYLEKFPGGNFESIPFSQMQDSLRVYDSLNAKLDELVERYTLSKMGYSKDDLKRTAMGTDVFIPDIDDIRDGIYFMENYWNGPER